MREGVGWARRLTHPTEVQGGALHYPGKARYGGSGAWQRLEVTLEPRTISNLERVCGVIRHIGTTSAPAYIDDLQLVTDDPGATTYDVEVATDSTFANGIEAWTGIAAPAAGDRTLTVEGLSQATAYHWRVRATNAAGTGPWSEDRFTTIDRAPRRYYIKDHLGSIRAVVDPDAPGTGAHKVVETRDYYPFGLRMPGRSMTPGTETAEDYTGHELDGETGMHYAGARYYMSALGRWNGPDPLADAFPGHSSYNYSLNNPINLVDPNGMEPCPYDESQECGVIMDELVVEAERPKKTASYGIVNGTFYFNSSTRAGRGGLYDFMRSNPGATRQMIGNNNYSMAAQQVAFNANIHNGQASFLETSLSMAGHGLSAASLLTGAGVGVLGGRMLLANSGKLLLGTKARIAVLEKATTGLSLASYASFTAAGDYDNANVALTGAVVGWAGTAGRLAQATRGLKAAPKMNGVLYRNAATGQTVGNGVFGARYGTQTLGALSSSYGVYLVEPSK